MIKVGYCAGHGGYKNKLKKLYATPGKRTPDGEPEWEFNDNVARAFANELSLYEGVASKRFDDPTGQRDVPLKERTDRANDWGANYYFSFHHNGLSSVYGYHTGVETFVYTNPNPKSVALANAIHPAVVKAYGLNNRGVKKGNLHIVRETKMPAVLVEGGFMDSFIDIKKLRDNMALENAGKLIAQAFAKHVGLKKSSEVQGVSITKGELTVGQYEELKKIIEIQAKRIAVLEEQVKAQQLNDTGKYSCKELIKKAVADGTFKATHLSKLDKYSDGDLTSYALTYANNKLG
ncbi:N-acetylmuramoyl-L-alanine amidase [Lysinibacillus sp. SGAir0095]|uniref:N-acetylmuramoyl-L-alanine amidase n=1 Tax=Lysinibacillus sp. SGAir0095 TaxID=2070463 RepID=UPI0010CD0F5C|nr:N-acetylmuramoyl-L-alanine amidase [Lysinibacillus sp. SGAir0095]QCR33111.1 N-acetylmuramoyl-L-alanine amidase [Lysinibacillus sp. SGAir0095]